MKFTDEMILMSDSGYCMPYEIEDEAGANILLGYGEQNNPVTGEKFHHTGVDFETKNTVLYALASGRVCGVGNDQTWGIFQTIRYGKYEVTYGHLTNISANFGSEVVAGQPVSIASNMMHIGVTFDGQEMDPMEFLGMLYGNVTALEKGVKMSLDPEDEVSRAVKTDYDESKNEIESMMLKHLPDYLKALFSGSYSMPMNKEASLRNIFSLGTMKEVFYEKMPSFSNPLGLGMRALPLIIKVQNMLIEDFLSFMQMFYSQVFSQMGGDDILKKKVTTPPPA